MLLKRIDGADWKALTNAGFQHVDGMVYEVPKKQADGLVKEQPTKWAKATKADLPGNLPPREKVQPKPSGGTMTSDSTPALSRSKSAQAEESARKRPVGCRPFGKKAKGKAKPEPEPDVDPPVEDPELEGADGVDDEEGEA